MAWCWRRLPSFRKDPRGDRDLELLMRWEGDEAGDMGERDRL